MADNSLLAVPFGLDFLADGTLVVADYGGHRVCTVGRDGRVSVLAGDGEKGHRDGPGGKARFNGPHNVAVTPAGDVLVSDTLNHCVRRIDGKTGEVSTVAGSPEKGFAGDGGPARDARLNQAYHVCATADGFLVADLGNRRNSAGRGRHDPYRGGDRQAWSSHGRLSVRGVPVIDPRAVARDSEGNVWVLERSGNALSRHRLPHGAHPHRGGHRQDGAGVGRPRPPMLPERAKISVDREVG